jgi:Transglycosylase SLT domain
VANSSIQQLITNAALNAGVPPQLALAQAQQESGLNPAAYNPSSGATGLFQLEPGTASDLGVTNPLDAAQSAQGGMTYMAQLYQKFGNWTAALAAYDWGMGNVAKAQAQYGADWLDYAPTETQNYVSSILGSAGMDSTATVTPSSVVSGAVNAIQDLFSPAPAAPSIDDDSEDDGSSPSTFPLGTALLVGGGVLGAWLLVKELADR